MDGGTDLLMNPSQHRHSRRRPHRLLRLLFLAALLLALVWWGNNSIQTTTWDLRFSDLPEGFDGCRVLVLGDTHGKWFGEGNQTLFQTASDADPDYIFFVGDLEDDDRGPVPEYPETLAEGLSAIAPTYYVTGNHEWAIGDVPELKNRLETHGITVLSNETVLLERNGDTIPLAGIDDPNGRADQKTPEEVAADLHEEYGPDPFWILLAHRNNRFATEYRQLGADLVVSGHGHGGVIRLPFRKEGFLTHSLNRDALHPRYTAGVYEEEGSTLFVTRGLGNSGISFRIFNRPEAAVLTLHRDS